MSFFSQFNIFRFFPQNLKQNIKCLYVSEEHEIYKYKPFAYCVDSDDCVYGFGDGMNILGYCDQQNDAKYIIIKELCKENIVEFSHQSDTAFALSSTGQVFYWTKYDLTLRTRNRSSSHGYYSKPKLIEYLSDKSIVQVNCSVAQCLALSSYGIIYSYDFEQNTSTELIFEPMLTTLERINSDDKDDMVKFVFSSDLENKSAFIVTFNGELIQSYIDQDDEIFKKISNLGYSCASGAKPDEFEVEIIRTQHKYNSPYTMLICHDNSVFEYTFPIPGYHYQTEQLRQTDYKTIFDYILAQYQKTYKTVYKIDDKFYINDLFRDQTNGTLIKTLSEVKTESNSLSGFQTVNNLPNLLESVVKSYFYTRLFYMTELSALFVKSNGQELSAYVIGNNVGGQLGLGHRGNVNEQTIVRDLCDQNIDDIFIGTYCMFARNDKDDIFEWGSTEGTHLVNESDKRNLCLKPRKIQFFQNKKIVQIFCGYEKCFALSRDGIVYGWDVSLAHLSVRQPFNVNDVCCPNSKIKLVHCYKDYDRDFYFFVTSDDQIYSVDKDWNFRLLSCNVKDIKKVIIKSLFKYVLIILNEEGQLFIHDLNEKTEPIELETDVMDIHDYKLHSTVTALECRYGVYELTYDYLEGSTSYMYKIKETNYINYFDYLLNKFNTTEKLIHVSKEGFLYTKSVKFNDEYTTDPNEDVLICVDKNIYERKFDNLFTIIDYIGEGGFGEVLKVEDIATKQIFAIKKTKELDDKDMKAIKSLINEIIITKLESDFVVQFYDSWIEGTASYSDDIKDIKINKQLYFRMGLCLQSLQDFLKDKRKMFKIKYLDIDYYISCLLFKELTECVNYLHELKPQIIHRDLKPLNVLISDGNNGRFLKLCDFGLSKIIKQSNVTKIFESESNEDIVNMNSETDSKHTRLGGTDPFMAPEVKNNTVKENKTLCIYNEKCDIYSLALIAIEIYTMVTIDETEVKKLFDEKNLYQYFTRYSCPLESVPNDKINSLKVLLENCIFSEDYNRRHSCQQIIEKINELFINETDLQNIEEFLEKINELEDDCPFRMYCQKKLSLKS